jgi:hypothetical protein
MSTNKDEYIKSAYQPAWILRLEKVDPSKIEFNSQMGNFAVDGFSVQQRGLLGIILCLILLEPTKSVREDQLWLSLQELDRFVN